MIPKKPPIHLITQTPPYNSTPGRAIIYGLILHGLNIKDLSERLGGAQRFMWIVSGGTPIKESDDKVLSEFFNTPSRFWLNSYELYEERIGEFVCGLLDANDITEELYVELQCLLGGTHAGWESTLAIRNAMNFDASKPTPSP